MRKQMKRFSCGEMEALTALCDTFWPSIPHISHHHHLHHFFQTSASMAGTPLPVAELLGGKIQHPKLYLGRIALSLLSTWIGTFILCGRNSLSVKFPYFQRFSKVSSEKREQILLSWSTSYFSLLRILFEALKIFILLTFFTQVDEKDEENLSWKAIGYCGPDPDLKARKQNANKETEDEEALFGPLHKGIINLRQSRDTALEKLRNLGFDISKSSRRRSSLNPSFVVKCDAVVVGSGSGGGVVAGVLAQAGYKVLVLEKGSYLARSNLSLLEGEAMDQMYLGHGILGTDNLDVLLLAGSTVGGGSTVNWSASIRTPEHVRKEWSEKHGLELFESKAYEEALDVVCRKMGVQSEFEDEGFNSMILRKGCENLGYKVENVPRNAPSDHYCGWCCLGCKDGRKKGSSETWLVDLVESGNGAILPECEAIKVMTHEKKAIGVAFALEGKEEVGMVESKVTVVACGALCTPTLLKRSGLRNVNIGRNLHVHPVVMAWGYFPESRWPEADKRSYEGGIMTAMWKDSESDIVIQTPALHPGMFSALIPWVSGSDMKKRMSRYSRTAHVFALARDRGCGVVRSESDISYRLEKGDEENLRGGIEKAMRILAGAGAQEIGSHDRRGRVLVLEEDDEDELERFVKEESSSMALRMCSAHQMGSCRMGVHPTDSAVNPKGETWEVEALFLADSSLFPTALGVNPMLTVQAIAYCIAQSLLGQL